MLFLFIGRGGKGLSELKMTIPPQWEEVSSDRNEKVLCLFDDNKTITAKIRLVSLASDSEILQEELEKRVSGHTIVKRVICNFEYNGVKWCQVSYTCKDVSLKYWDFYYVMQDNCYLIIELLTEDPCAAREFKQQVCEIIMAIDYSAISLDNHILIGESDYVIKTPPLFRFSGMSTNQRLLFLSENGYLIVNVPMEDDLFCCVERQIKSANLFIDSVKITLQDCKVCDNFEEISYKIENIESCEEGGTGIYFRQKLEEDVFVTSFMFQRGESGFDTSTLLNFRKGDSNV